LLVELENVENFSFRFLACCECGMTFLPEELTGAKEWLWMLEFPALEKEEELVKMLKRKCRAKKRSINSPQHCSTGSNGSANLCRIESTWHKLDT
jgi:hypothetical protein